MLSVPVRDLLMSQSLKSYFVVKKFSNCLNVQPCNMLVKYILIQSNNGIIYNKNGVLKEHLVLTDVFTLINT